MKRLSNEDLTAIRERAEKATDGPWRVGATVSGYLEIQSKKTEFPTQDTMDFIAHSREDIPKLLAEIERLRRIIDWNASCVVCVKQLGEGWKYDKDYGELLCGECFENRYGGKANDSE